MIEAASSSGRSDHEQGAGVTLYEPRNDGQLSGRDPRTIRPCHVAPREVRPARDQDGPSPLAQDFALDRAGQVCGAIEEGA